MPRRSTGNIADGEFALFDFAPISSPTATKIATARAGAEIGSSVTPTEALSDARDGNGRGGKKLCSSVQIAFGHFANYIF